MVKTSKQERRGWVRAKRVLSIQFRLKNSKAKKSADAWCLSMTQDMSAGGLSFYTDREFKINDILELHVVMSGILDIYNGFGKVVRVERKKTGAYFLIGIKFVDKSMRTRKVKSYVAKPTVKKRGVKRI